MLAMLATVVDASLLMISPLELPRITKPAMLGFISDARPANAEATGDARTGHHARQRLLILDSSQRRGLRCSSVVVVMRLNPSVMAASKKLRPQATRFPWTC